MDLYLCGRKILQLTVNNLTYVGGDESAKVAYTGIFSIEDFSIEFVCYKDGSATGTTEDETIPGTWEEKDGLIVVTLVEFDFFIDCRFTVDDDGVTIIPYANDHEGEMPLYTYADDYMSIAFYDGGDAVLVIEEITLYPTWELSADGDTAA